MRVLLVGAAIINLVLAAPALADGAVATLTAHDSATDQPYELPNTQVRQIQSITTKAFYRLFIATPADYATSGKTYPVVYMLDADYSFALTRNVVQHFAERGKLPEMILVAIAYPGAADDMEVYYSNRKRDYTPSASIAVGYSAHPGHDEDGQNGQGGADHFRAFIGDELVPYMESHFPVTSDRTFIGHSYGGLFGTYVLLTQPDLFKRYVIISPSLWFDHDLLLRVEAKDASHHAIQAHAFFAVGSLETQGTTGTPMVQDLKQFYKKLAARRNSGLELSLHICDGETHESVFPGAVTRGLLTVFQDAPRSS